MSKILDRTAFSQMCLAKALEGEVQAWVNQGWPGVTQTTLELFNYWFQRGMSFGRTEATFGDWAIKT